ncbi:MAG: hypothetical protein FWE49_05255, partial [Synergistaceae bacterium]|nr:hypothetical protein [Synergistaceae bacterium]
MSEMDHTTRNAILELASQIGQPLRDELKASFFELAGHFELFRKSLQEISSSMNGSQDSLKLAANELLPKIETAKRELEIATEIFREAVQSLSEGFFEKLDVRIADIVNNSGKITESLSGELSYLSNDLRSVERVINENSLNLTDTSKKLDDTTVGLRKEIGNWNGLLRATSHAHSTELEALSTEISELMRNIETRLLEKVDEHINARDNRVRQDISKNNAMLTQLLTHTARLEKSLWFGGILVVAVIV